MSGKPYGTVAEQCKRKIIIEIESPFPSVRKRLKVVSRREEVLSPIQTSRYC